MIKPVDKYIAITLPKALKHIGFIIGIFGTWLALWCIVLFVKVGKGTPALFDSPRKFVAVGPFQHVRNPMYVGSGSMLLAVGFILASPAIVLLAALYWILAHLLVVLHEEPTLERKFGKSYIDYKKSVNRWWPKC